MLSYLRNAGILAVYLRCGNCAGTDRTVPALQNLTPPRPVDSGLHEQPVVSGLAARIACVRCKQPLAGTSLQCTGCGFRLEREGNVVSALPEDFVSYFDSRHELMAKGNTDPGTYALFYERQIASIESHLGDAHVVLDIGCGPALPYRPRADNFVVGLDPSSKSLQANRDIALGLHASSVAIPLAGASVDLAVCFYSIHHMTGATRAANEDAVNRTFAEIGRVVRPGGKVLVYEVSPAPPFGWIERLSWNSVKRLLGEEFDMYFWSGEQLARIARERMPGATFEGRRFGGLAFTPMAPVFSRPRLRMPRFLYPFSINLYAWTLPLST